MKEVSKQRIEDIKCLLPLNTFKMTDFFLATHFSLQELQVKTREKKLCMHRQVGSVYSVLTGLSLSESADIFNQKHCTIHHSIKVFHAAVCFPNSYPEMYYLIERVCKMSTSNSFCVSNVALFNQYRIMDQIIAPLLKTQNASAKSAAKLIENRAKILGV